MQLKVTGKKLTRQALYLNPGIAMQRRCWFRVTSCGFKYWTWHSSLFYFGPLLPRSETMFWQYADTGATIISTQVHIRQFVIVAMLNIMVEVVAWPTCGPYPPPPFPPSSSLWPVSGRDPIQNLFSQNRSRNKWTPPNESNGVHTRLFYFAF